MKRLLALFKCFFEYGVDGFCHAVHAHIVGVDTVNRTLVSAVYAAFSVDGSAVDKPYLFIPAFLCRFVGIENDFAAFVAVLQILGIRCGNENDRQVGLRFTNDFVEGQVGGLQVFGVGGVVIVVHYEYRHI